MTQPRHSSRTGHVGYIFRDMCKGFLHPGRDMTAGCCAAIPSVAAAPGGITHPAVCDGRQGPGRRCPNRSMPARHGTTAGAACHPMAIMAAMAQTAARGCREMDQRKTTVNRPGGMTAASSPQHLVGSGPTGGLPAPVTGTCHQRPVPPADGHRPCMAKSEVMRVAGLHRSSHLHRCVATARSGSTRVPTCPWHARAALYL